MAGGEFESRTASKDDAAYGTIVVVGGGCYGSYYVRQLCRASRAGAVTWDRVLVVDRNADCMVAAEIALEQPGLTSPHPVVVVSEWTAFFARYLSAWSSSRDSKSSDAIVPSPLMPHLLYEWVRDRAKDRWPGRQVLTRPIQTTLDTQWESAAPDGTRYVSFATWTCPINCIEPDTCPHTRSERTWTMPRAMERLVERSSEGVQKLAGPLVFHCTHRVFGVGMIPVDAVIEADNFVSKVAENGSAEVLVATVSHCHGAANVLSIG